MDMLFSTQVWIEEPDLLCIRVIEVKTQKEKTAKVKVEDRKLLEFSVNLALSPLEEVEYGLYGDQLKDINPENLIQSVLDQAKKQVN